jgi:hypothetical protein
MSQEEFAIFGICHFFKKIENEKKIFKLEIKESGGC